MLTRLAGAHEEIAALGRRLAKAPPRLVRLAAHGTSDNAATYAVYALRLLPGWSAVRDSISLPVYYAPPTPRARARPWPTRWRRRRAARPTRCPRSSAR